MPRPIALLLAFLLAITLAYATTAPRALAGSGQGPDTRTTVEADSRVPDDAPTLWLPLVNSGDLVPTKLHELIPGFDYAAWYEAETGYAPNPEYFGAYSIEPYGDSFYVGFGTARPAEDGNDGALFANSDGKSISAISPLTDQGFVDMTLRGDTVFIPGADPTNQDEDHQWDWGNTYVYNPPDDFVKYRNLPNVIHSWGLWYDAQRALLYAAVSSHLGDYATWTGEVFVSSDDAQTWTRLADRDDGVGEYRTYDIIGFNHKLYITWNDEYLEPCGIAESSTAGLTWTRIAALDLQTACRTRLFEFDGRLLVLNFARDGLYTIDGNGDIGTFGFPDFRVQEWAYNYLTTDAAGNLYTITDDGRVVRSNDLIHWETVLSTDRSFITVSYWPDQNWLILADRGAEYGGIWWIDLTKLEAINLPPTPEASIAQDETVLLLDWDDSTGVYRVYQTPTPYLSSTLMDMLARVPVSELLIPVGEETSAYYLVRAEESEGNLSLESNRTGTFRFGLVAGE